MPQAAFQYGGQAVIEGVMMRGPRELAVAVRREDGGIAVEQSPATPLGERYPVLRWPLLRGCVALGESLVLGMHALIYSANQAGQEEEELSTWEITATMLLAIGLAVLLFIVVPSLAAHLAKTVGPFWQNVIEGLVRIAVFLAYIIGIARMKEIERVFQYHGAEHKVIHTYERGEALTVANARRHSTLHPRCGTSFLFVVLILTILVYSLLDTPGLAWRIGSRVLLLPLIAGAGYEFIKFSGRHSANRFVAWLVAPGLALQRLTTREPDDAQLEVALRALTSLLEEGPAEAPVY